MPDEHWENLKEIFNAAVALNPVERAAYLEEVCAHDIPLRKSIESLIKSHEEPEAFVDAPAYQAAAEMLVDGQDFEAGQMVAHYRILSLLGEGGMGKVYLAQDTKLHRKVSLKFLAKSLTQEPGRLHRFEQEARSVSKLNHPNILTIHEIGEADGQRFMVTEFIEGKTLRDRLNAPLEIAEALEIATQVASALVAAHRVNIVHRDIKPENIMVRDEDALVKVLDFGLAKVSELPRVGSASPKVTWTENTPITTTAPGIVMGTVAYMSPEQARAEEVDERTDIWSLGLVLYEMVAGCLPFPGSTSNEIISAILSRDQPPPLARYAREVPPELQEIVTAALVKDKTKRYQTSHEVLTDLKRVRQSVSSPGGFERASTAERQAAPTLEVVRQPTRKDDARRQRSFIPSLMVPLLLGAALVVIGAGALFYAGRSKHTTALAHYQVNSIAVLPFLNAESDPELEYLTDGITDNIIERLSEIPDLKVMSRSSVFHYKGHETDVQTVGRELSVEAVLVGRVVKRNDMLTIHLELVDTKDNSHIWGQQYAHKSSDFVAMQSDIPVDVSNRLRSLSDQSKERLTRSSTSDSEAYELYLKGRYAWEKWTPVGTKEAIDFFQEAIKKDPKFAAAYSGLADAYVFSGVGDLPHKEVLRRGREAATTALELDPMLGEAHASLAEVLLSEDWDFAGSDKEFQRAIQLSPSYAEAHHMYSHLLLLLGRVDDSYGETRKFLALDPLSEAPVLHLGYHYLYARQYDEAIEQIQTTFHLSPPDEAEGRGLLGDAYCQKGMFREGVEEYYKALTMRGAKTETITELKSAFARAGIHGYLKKRIQEVQSEQQTPDENAFPLATYYARMGKKDQAFAWLEKAYAAHSDAVLRLKEEVLLDNLHSDPRYTDLLRRVGLPQ
jgi:serine/threonine-protein kinase